MAKPPSTPPSSDLKGVNRDARAGQPSGDSASDPGEAVHGAKQGSKARPDETAPDEG